MAFIFSDRECMYAQLSYWLTRVFQSPSKTLLAIASMRDATVDRFVPPSCWFHSQDKYNIASYSVFNIRAGKISNVSVRLKADVSSGNSDCWAVACCFLLFISSLGNNYMIVNVCLPVQGPNLRQSSYIWSHLRGVIFITLLLGQWLHCKIAVLLWGGVIDVALTAKRYVR